jgi:hypothetical protein
MLVISLRAAAGRHAAVGQAFSFVSNLEQSWLEDAVKLQA